MVQASRWPHPALPPAYLPARAEPEGNTGVQCRIQTGVLRMRTADPESLDESDGSPSRLRSCRLCVQSAALFRMSYRAKTWYRCRDSNPVPRLERAVA